MKKTILAVVASVFLAGATIGATETAAEAKPHVNFYFGIHKSHPRVVCNKVWRYRHHHWVRVKVCSTVKSWPKKHW